MKILNQEQRKNFSRGKVILETMVNVEDALELDALF